MFFANFDFPRKARVRLLSAAVTGVLLALSWVPLSALAVDIKPAESAPDQVSPVKIALAASSRFAAPSDEELQIQKMTERRREELREKRRQWQNQASEAAVERAEQEQAAKEAAEQGQLDADSAAERLATP